MGMKKTGDMHQTRYIKGPVTLCNFFSNLSRNVVARQVAGELHSVTWVVSQLVSQFYNVFVF